MWLQRFTEKAALRLIVLGLALAVSACASNGSKGGGAEGGRAERSAAVDPRTGEITNGVAIPEHYMRPRHRAGWGW